MTGLAELFASRGIDVGHELPDHIGVLLRSLEKLRPSERAEVLRHCFEASLKSMQVELARQNNPYQLAIAAVAELVRKWLEQAEATDD
jgi:nitrate reductase assembly molybdenum cofactor insertion protein NarJ